MLVHDHASTLLIAIQLLWIYEYTFLLNYYSIFIGSRPTFSQSISCNWFALLFVSPCLWCTLQTFPILAYDCWYHYTYIYVYRFGQGTQYIKGKLLFVFPIYPNKKRVRSGTIALSYNLPKKVARLFQTSTLDGQWQYRWRMVSHSLGCHWHLSVPDSPKCSRFAL